MTYSIETETCHRCFGTGRYGPVVVYNGKCFNCLGTGKVYTRNGGKVADLLVAATHVSAEDLTVGMQVWFEAINAGSFQMPARKMTITAIDGTDITFEDGSTSHGGGTYRKVTTRAERQEILASFAPRAGLLLDGEPTKVTKSRKSDEEKAATKEAARVRAQAKRDAVPASEAQIKFAKTLADRAGVEGDFDSLTKKDASRFINSLI